MHILYSIQNNTNNLGKVVNQDFGLIDEVSSQTNNFKALKTIQGQKYQMLLAIHSREEMDHISYQVESIQFGNKVMLSLYKDIQEMQAKVQDQILEKDNYYNVASGEIFNDESNEKMSVVEVVVQQFKASLEVVASEDDVRRIFKTKENLKELDSKLDDFVAIT